jgi:hypothetical protein
MMIVTDQLLHHFIAVTHEFLEAMRNEDFDQLWNYLITNEAANLLASMSFPLIAFDEGKIDKLLTAIPNSEVPISIEEGLALAFQKDMQGIRSATFSAMTQGFEAMGWYNFKETTCIAFAEEACAVLIAETTPINLVVPLIKVGESYKVDFEALGVFSMFFSASKIYKIGLRAIEIGKTDLALAYLETATSLAKPLNRLRRILFEHPFAHMMVSEARRAELRNEETAVLMARDQVLKIMAVMESKDQQIDTAHFMQEVFQGYKAIPTIDLSGEELGGLYTMNDGNLRQAISKILVGVNPVEARREAEKPHSPAEIADMELKVRVGQNRYLLCMPFKSGLEVKTETVPVDIAYQIIRPFMYFPNCVVVFVTAKPCSQYLLNYLKLATETQGWAIEVIQGKELGKLLKLNHLL